MIGRGGHQPFLGFTPGCKSLNVITPQLPIESPKRNTSREKILRAEGKKPFVLKCKLAAISLSPTSLK